MTLSALLTGESSNSAPDGQGEGRAPETATKAVIPPVPDQIRVQEKDVGKYSSAELVQIRDVIRRRRTQVLVSACAVMDSASELLRLRGWDPLMRPFKGENNTVDIRASVLRPTVVRFCFTRGRILQSLDLLAEAKSEFQRSLCLANRWMPAQVELSKCFLALGEYAQARAVLTSAFRAIYPQRKTVVAAEVMGTHPELGMLLSMAEEGEVDLSQTGYGSADQNRVYSLQQDGRLLYQNRAFVHDHNWGHSVEGDLKWREHAMQRKADEQVLQDTVGNFDLLSRMKKEMAKAREILKKHEEAMNHLVDLSFVEMHTSEKRSSFRNDRRSFADLPSTPGGSFAVAANNAVLAVSNIPVASSNRKFSGMGSGRDSEKLKGTSVVGGSASASVSRLSTKSGSPRHSPLTK